MSLLTMVTTTLKQLFSKPATTQYPFVKREPIEKTRGHIENDLDLCIYCGICQKKCPTEAIKVTRTPNPNSWQIEVFRCITCGVCADVCPKKSITMKPHYSNPSSKRY